MLASWFREVPAYRIAAFRVVLATTTLCNYLPVLTGWLLEAAASPATIASIPWIIHVPLPVVVSLLVLAWVAGVALLTGWRPSLSAAYLAALGVYGYAVGNHSHNGFLHLLLLALVACSADGLTLRRLAGGRDTDAMCPAWPERLLRLQLALVYFHTSIDKLFSPEWGLRGLRLMHLESTRVLPGIAHLERGIAAAIAAVAGPLSVATMVGEMGIAIGLTLRRLWPFAMAGNVAFALSLEFLLVPAMFPWDLLALMILFLPAADGGYRVRLNDDCGTCRAQRRGARGARLDAAARPERERRGPRAVRDRDAPRAPLQPMAGYRPAAMGAAGAVPGSPDSGALRRRGGRPLDSGLQLRRRRVRGARSCGAATPAACGPRRGADGVRAGRLCLEPCTVPRAGCRGADGCVSAAPRQLAFALTWRELAAPAPTLPPGS